MAPSSLPPGIKQDKTFGSVDLESLPREIWTHPDAFVPRVNPSYGEVHVSYLVLLCVCMLYIREKGVASPYFAWLACVSCIPCSNNSKRQTTGKLLETFNCLSPDVQTYPPDTLIAVHCSHKTQPLYSHPISDHIPIHPLDQNWGFVEEQGGRGDDVPGAGPAGVLPHQA